MGCWIGAWIVHDGAFTGALRTIDHYIVQTLSDTDRVTILIFSMVLGGMVGVLSRSGGTIGLVEAMEPYATNSRRGQVVSWTMGILIFFDLGNNHSGVWIFGIILKCLLDIVEGKHRIPVMVKLCPCLVYGIMGGQDAVAQFGLLQCVQVIS